MGKLEVGALYLLAFFVFLYAWRDATSKLRESREQTNPRAGDIARGDRNFAIFAGLYVVLIIFVTSKFMPNAKMPNIAMKPSGPVVTWHGKRIKARALIFENGKLRIEDETGKIIDVGKSNVRIELPRGTTRDS